MSIKLLLEIELAICVCSVIIVLLMWGNAYTSSYVKDCEHDGGG